MTPAAVRTPRTAPLAVSIPVTSVSVLQVAPSSWASFAKPSATARVPPIGYQTPSAVCMWAMAQSTAGAP